MNTAAALPREAHATASAVIELAGIRKSYTLGETLVEALRSVSLTVARSELVALQGPSGSGKSTLLNICGLIDTPDAGRYRLGGMDTTGLGATQRALLRRRDIGFIFQSFNLVPVMSAFENVEYPLLLNGVGRADRRAQVTEILRRVGLADFAHHRPDRLSGGQRQRVAVARALVKRPAVVIADEPTASLDGDTAAAIIDMLNALARETGAGVLVATHDERMARHCSRAVRLVDGRVQ